MAPEGVLALLDHRECCNNRSIARTAIGNRA